jgi:phosphopantetheinyl transferase (holo-ACP synthase)
MLVGNDVVDLDDPDNLRAPLHPRFRERVLDERERAELAQSADQHALIWSFFAAKEAAYKLLVKLGDSPGLGYRRIEVAPDLASVRFADRVLALRVVRSAGFVHALAAQGEIARVTVAVERLATGAQPSAAVRRLAARIAAPLVGAPASELQIVREVTHESWDGLGPPELRCSGRALPIDLSLSHDGRWVAAAARVIDQGCFDAGPRFKRSGVPAEGSPSRADAH